MTVNFRNEAIIWQTDYRGQLVFLDQAWAQRAQRDLQIEDGWTYFIHGWTRVIAEVFHVDIPVSGPIFDELSYLATRFGKTAVRRDPLMNRILIIPLNDQHDISGWFHTSSYAL